MDKKTGTAIYTEMGWEAEVEILEDNSDQEWERYKLKVIRTRVNSGIFRTPEDGSEFTAEARRGFRIYVGWNLYGGAA